MKKQSMGALVCAVVLTAALSVGLVGCGSKVAATVGSETIYEDEVTAYIESMRSSYGATDSSTWALYLAYYFGTTAEGLRNQVVNMFVNNKLSLLAAKEKGLTVDSATVDASVKQVSSQFESDTAWKTALKNAGFTEDEYRKSVEESLIIDKLIASLGVSENPTDDEVLKVAKDNLKYFNGARRSSHILFSSDDEETAKQVLSDLNAGTITFSDAVSQYSLDTTSAEAGGDVGWTRLNSFVSAYDEAVNKLEKDQLSDLVETEYGFHIIKCTDVLSASDDLTSLSQLPDDFATFFKQLANTTTTENVFTEWLNGYRTTVKVAINDMPSNVSYNVDVESSLSSSITTSTESSSNSSSN